jgi:DNA-binding MarR family transcriptional regulator
MKKGVFISRKLKDEDMPPGCKIFYAVLSDLSKKEKKITKDNAELAQMENVSKSTIHHWLTILEKKNYINRVYHGSGRGVELKREIWVL